MDQQEDGTRDLARRGAKPRGTKANGTDRASNAGRPNTALKPGLGFYLREAYRAFCREFDMRLARHGITHAQWVLLWFLARSGTLTPLELSRAAGIQKASATAVIDALKKRRLIKGDRDRVDRRKVNLYLTPHGEQMVVELMQCAAETNALARTGLSDSEAQQLLRLLARATTNLESGSRVQASETEDEAVD
jgi:DNA-binding MarR family transcriptional regulator